MKVGGDLMSKDKKEKKRKKRMKKVIAYIIAAITKEMIGKLIEIFMQRILNWMILK